MPVRETPSAKIERLLASGDNAGALQAANELLAQSPGSFLGRLGRARANMRMANYIEAESDITLALKLSPNDDQARLVRAGLDHRLGRIDACIEWLLPVARGRGAQSVEASVNILQAYHSAGRFDEIAAMLKAGGPWEKDPRVLLTKGQLLAREDSQAGIVALKEVFRAPHPTALRRSAGFEAVGLLDKAGRYREAFDLVREVHATTGERLDLNEWIGPMRQLYDLMGKGTAFFKPRGPREPGTAFIVALPRSGTTLLEHMLDRHPAIGGIGEFDGLTIIGRRLFATGSWPWNPDTVPASLYSELRQSYLDGARAIGKPGATWTFDKSLRTWRALPEVATLFPGAVCIAIDRDPRDVATSIFLSYFNPKTWEWTGDLGAIRQIIEWQRKLVSRGLETLELSHESIVYEDLVEDPAGHAERCLARMGLPMDERVLTPEQSRKTAFTLSVAQVRQPINRKSIGRWKNYEWAFDSSWDDLVAAHEARRTRR